MTRSQPASRARRNVAVSTCEPYATTKGGGPSPRSRRTRSSIASPGLARSTSTHAGLCRFAISKSKSADRADFTSSPKSWAVPRMRLMNIRSSESSSPDMATSNRFRPALAGADANAVVQRQDENLAVADATLGPGAARLHDRVDRRLDEVFVDGNL